jgi:hypothetical protein
VNTARAVPLELFSRAVVLNASSIAHLLREEGLLLISEADHHVVAQWPIRPARVPHDLRRSVVFTRNDQNVWRGAYLESEAGNGLGLKDTKPHFKDLLHVGIWLRGHAPQDEQSGPARVV